MSGSSGDSFFTAHNYYDKQVQSFDPHHCEDLIEAGVRHLSHIRGPIYIATRLQRLADICAGVHVLPIEHWNVKQEPKAELQAPAPEVAPLKPRRMLNAGFWNAFFLGWFFCTIFHVVLRLAL